jgi:hypothetical protein
VSKQVNSQELCRTLSSRSVSKRMHGPVRESIRARMHTQLYCLSYYALGRKGYYCQAPQQTCIFAHVSRSSAYLHRGPLVLLSLVLWAVSECAGSSSKELLHIPDVEAARANVLAQLLWVLHSQQPWSLSLLPLPLLLHNTALHMKQNIVRKGHQCCSVAC